MAQEDRQFTADVVAFTLESNDYLATLKSASVHVTAELRESRAAKDTWKFPRAFTKGWSVTSSLANEGAIRLNGLVGSTVTLLLTTSAETGSVKYSGEAVVGEAGHEMADEGAQTETITLTGQGALTIGAAT